MKRVLAAACGSLLFCSQLPAASLGEITGAVAYTEPFQFDYTKDGTRNRVQFWLEFKGSPALGDPDDPGFRPESGAISYYLVDMDNRKQVDNWLMGFSMMEEPPPSGPYPMTDIAVDGKVARFSAFGLHWTVVDGGDGYLRDEVTVDDGFITRKMNMFAGDLQVIESELAALIEAKDCAECHQQAVTAMLTKGGEHAPVACRECHVGHPPEEQHSYTGCLECHDPHAGQMGAESCAQCHRAHTAAEVLTAWNVPSEYCQTCHQEAAYVLSSSRSRHSDIACVRCHQERHTEASSCQYCHGAPHPQHVMANPDICAACHNSAHDLESARQR